MVRSVKQHGPSVGVEGGLGTSGTQYGARTRVAEIRADAAVELGLENGGAAKTHLKAVAGLAVVVY